MFKKKVNPNRVKITGLSVDLGLESIEQPELLKALTKSKNYQEYTTRTDNTEKYYNTMTNISRPQFKILSALAPHIQYRNVLLLSREELSSILGTCPTNLTRKLKTAEPFIKAFNVEVGFVRIIMHPELAFVCETEVFDAECAKSKVKYQEDLQE